MCPEPSYGCRQGELCRGQCGQGKKVEPIEICGDAWRSPSPEMWLTFPRSVLPGSRTEGGGNGGKEAPIIMMWNTNGSILEKYCIKKHPHHLIWIQSPIVTQEEKSVLIWKLERMMETRIQMLTQSKLQTKYTFMLREYISMWTARG